MLSALATGAGFLGCSTVLDIAQTSSTDADGAAGDGADGARDGSVLDAKSTDAPPDAKPGCNGALACQRVVFLTSSLFSRGDLVTADTKCNEIAAAPDAGVVARVAGREFVAWVTTIDGDPSLRFSHGTAEYVLPNDTQIAANWAALVSGAPLSSPIDVNERGGLEDGGGNIYVWTATDSSGKAKAPPGNCSDWLLTTGSTTIGDWTSNATWTDFLSNYSCIDGNLAHLYCFEK